MPNNQTKSSNRSTIAKECDKPSASLVDSLLNRGFFLRVRLFSNYAINDILNIKVVR